VLALRADAPPVYVAAAPFFEREMFVGAQIVDPKLLRPGFLGGGFAVEEQDIGLDALGLKDAGGQTKQSVNVGLFK
jgi:hypothetical protein